MRFTLFIAFIGVFLYGFGRQDVKVVTPPKSQKVVKAEPVQKLTLNNGNSKKYHVKLSTSGNSGVTTVTTPEQEIENCKAHIKALDDKEAHIRATASDLNDPKIVKWLNDANATRESLKQRIKSLE